MRLRQDVSKMGLLFVSVGAMIGSGWLFGPLYAIRLAGPSALFCWMLGGLLVFCVALVFAELAVMFPVAGGVARFAQFSHGPLVSYCVSWVAWLGSVLLPVIEIQALLQYGSNHWPQLIDATAGSPQLSLWGFLVAAILLLIMSALNMIGLKWVARCNTALVSLKLFVPLLTVWIFWKTSFHVDNLTKFGGFFPYGIKNFLAALPLAGVVFSFFGFRLAVELSAETNNPQKNLPFALLGSIVICVLLYTLVQWAFITVLPPSYLQQGWQHVTFVGDHGPFVGIALLLGLHGLVFLLYTDAILSPFGSALMVITSAARTNYAISVNRCFPSFLRRLNRQGVPYCSVILNFFVGMGLLIPFPGWQELVQFVVSALVVSHILAPVTLVALRLQLPDQRRLFRLPASTFVSWLAFVILNLLLYWTGWHMLSQMFCVMLLGIIVLFILRVPQNRQERLVLRVRHAAWLIPYFSGIAVISYLGNFGTGIAVLPWGWDMVLVVIFASIMFVWGVNQRLPIEQVVQQLNVEQHQSTHLSNSPEIHS